MRRLFGILTVTALALGTAEAQAGTLPFSGSLAIELVAGRGLGPIAALGSGVATVDGPLGSHINTLSVPASPFAAAGITVRNTAPTTGPTGGAHAFAGLELTVHNGAGTCAAREATAALLATRGKPFGAVYTEYHAVG